MFLIDLEANGIDFTSQRHIEQLVVSLPTAWLLVQRGREKGKGRKRWLNDTLRGMRKVTLRQTERVKHRWLDHRRSMQEVESALSNEYAKQS